MILGMSEANVKDITQDHFENQQLSGVSHYKNDVYSLALLMLEVCTLQRASLDISYKTHLDQIEDMYGVKLRFMLEGMLAQRASERPNFE